tara:strand:+ start:236 stop:388 length:153 start_codon:yes stop_codon:yes gene_type:complete
VNGRSLLGQEKSALVGDDAKDETLEIFPSKAQSMKLVYVDDTDRKVPTRS